MYAFRGVFPARMPLRRYMTNGMAREYALAAVANDAVRMLQAMSDRISQMMDRDIDLQGQEEDTGIWQVVGEQRRQLRQCL